MGKTRVVEVLLFNLVGSSFAQVTKEVEVANLTEECTGTNDAETFPETPYDTTEDGDNLKSAGSPSSLLLTSCPPSGGKDMTKRIPVIRYQWLLELTYWDCPACR